MAFILYGKTAINTKGGETAGETKAIDWLSCVPKVALFTAAYTPNQNTDELYSDISANEVANGNGYITGGKTCASPTVAYAAKVATFDAADPGTWTGATTNPAFSFRYAVTYDSTSGILIGYQDYGSTLTINIGDTFTYTFDAAGIWTETVP
jgi:hypothetical protein